VLIPGETVFKQPNYHHARNQKAQARKARQQEKQARRSTRVGPDGQTTEQDASAPAAPEVTVEEPK